MAPSENSKEIDRLYLLVCKAMKNSAGISAPTKENFVKTFKMFNELAHGHKKLLLAIGKL